MGNPPPLQNVYISDSAAGEGSRGHYQQSILSRNPIVPMRRFCIPAIFLFATLLMGCSKTYYLGRQPQSEFTYPNSNVEALDGRVSGVTSKTGFLSTPNVTAEMQKQAISKALSKSQDADILINYSTFKEISEIPVLPITIVKYRVEGTPAKESIGNQDLN